MAMGSVLHARLIGVAGRTYRSHAHLETPTEEVEAATSRLQQDAEEHDADAEEEEYAIQEQGANFVIRLRPDNAVIGFVIGAKGATKSRVEQETGSSISVSSKSRDPSESAEVTITAASRQAAVSAANRVNLLIDGALSGSRLDYTHFVSIPLATPEVQHQLRALKESVLADLSAAAAGIEESLFVDERKLHLTLVMLKLYSEERRQQAVRVLQQLQPRIRDLLQQRQLQVRLQGLQYMNDEPGAVHVVYLRVLDAQNAPAGSGGHASLSELQLVCKEVVQAIDAEGLLLPKDSRDVKLHATVMNTRHRRPATATATSAPPGFPSRSEQPKRTPFDSRMVLERGKGVDFGVQTLATLELSARKRVDDHSGYYHAVATIPLSA